MKTIQEIRNTPNLLISRIGANGGMGDIYKLGKLFASVIWSNGGGWEHVSIAPYKMSYTPSWKDMCELKDMFFNDNEVVVQFHPAKSEYVNNVINCLHLWRPVNTDFPTPPSILVGIRKGQGASEIKKEIADVLRENNGIL